MPKLPHLHPHQAAALPSEENGQIFAYLAESPVLPADDIALVTAAVMAMCKRDKVISNRVTVFSVHDVADFSKEAGEAYERLIKTMGFPGTADLICTDTASPHTDEDFGGLAFISKVLHTGPVPYNFSVHTHTGVSRKARLAYREKSAWNSKSRYMAVNDLLVFDPLNLHAATPLKPSNDAFLILLQYEAEIGTRAEHVALLRKHPRHVFDREVDGTEAAFELHNKPSSRSPSEKSRERIESIFLGSINHTREMRRVENMECEARKLPKSRRLKPLPEFDPVLEWGVYLSEMVGMGSAPVEAMGWPFPSKV